MVINPLENTVTEIKPTGSYFFATNTIDEPLKQLFKKEIKEFGDVVAMAPKDHLRALQQDLIKKGYRKIR